MENSESGEVRLQASPQRQKLLQARREKREGPGAREDCRGVSSPEISDPAAQKRGWGLQSKCPGSKMKGGHGKRRREGPGINKSLGEILHEKKREE